MKEKDRRQKMAREKYQNFTEQEEEKRRQYYQQQKKKLPEYRKNYYLKQKKSTIWSFLMILKQSGLSQGLVL